MRNYYYYNFSLNISVKNNTSLWITQVSETVEKAGQFAKNSLR